MHRRDVLAGLVASLAVPGAGLAAQDMGLELGPPQPFNDQTVTRRARALAARPYRPAPKVPAAWQDITYDQYRLLQFDTRKALWRDRADVPLRVDAFPPGLYFPKPVQINAVADGNAHPVTFNMGVFHNVDALPDLPHSMLGYSGLRLRSELREPGIYEEFAVFQGASYFRAIGTGLNYGLSARGLAINTAAPSGEEFPDFTEFWVEEPGPGNRHYVVHALMDSPSCAGAFRFDIAPGPALIMDVEAQLFARDGMDNFGLAPLTSMFLFDETNRDRFSDFRPAVHDSDGLLIRNGGGETIWRPLANPRDLQISAFLDRDPKGFGLMQRARRFGDFADLEAHYHNRPGLWVEPGEGWGSGSVTLVEIPADREIYDNIVAYWRPSDPLEPGQAHRMTYRLTWGADSDQGSGLRVLNTRMGERDFGPGYIIAIDFEDGPGVPEDLSEVTRLIRSSVGTVSEGVLQRNPETGGPRLAFSFDPGPEKLAEFRVQLRRDGAPLSEVWLYRWTA